MNQIAGGEKTDRVKALRPENPASLVNLSNPHSHDCLETCKGMVTHGHAQAQKAFACLVVHTELSSLHPSPSFISRPDVDMPSLNPSTNPYSCFDHLRLSRSDPSSILNAQVNGCARRV